MVHKVSGASDSLVKHVMACLYNYSVLVVARISTQSSANLVSPEVEQPQRTLLLVRLQSRISVTFEAPCTRASFGEQSLRPR
jgi:hypothetical protein